MEQQTPNTKPKPPHRRGLKLPFDGRKKDAGVWTYDNRIGLSVTLIVYLLLMIAFVGSKIVVGGKPHTQGMFIDLQTLELLEKEKERLEKKTKEQQQKDPIDWRSIKNQVSNENAMDEKLKDDRGTKTSELSDAAKQAEARMRANREEYERGLAEERAINERSGTKSGEERQDSKVKGRVTVSFSLSNPVRTSRKLVIPAYQCEGGGDVVVQITVNRSGKVTDASILSGGDECMQATALRAARISRFNEDNNAPAKQNGTITYIFIPQ